MSDLNDIVAVGLNLKPKTLLSAYAQGVFPWPSPGLPLLWHCPQKRGVLDFADLHVGKRLKQYLKKADWTYTINREFKAVIDACSERGEEGTWIIPEMKEAYTHLHELGHAHSVEVWNGKQELVGGLYGVDVAGTFAGESMFHREDNASKAAILFVVSCLKKAGREFMDTQVITPHMEALGGKEIPRTVFRKRLKQIQEKIKVLGPTHPFSGDGVYHYQDLSISIE